MIIESLKQTVDLFNVNIPIATPKLGKWNFNYGKEHWQNLGDYEQDAELPFIERQKYLLLLYKDRGYILNKNGGLQGYTFEGEMLLMVRSKISDPTYDYKYETHIKNLENESEKLYNAFSDCDGWAVKTWREIEVENEYDTNMDGLKIRFSLEFEY